MVKITRISTLEMGNKIKHGVEFVVLTERDRKSALLAAKYLGVLISTRVLPQGGFKIYFL